LIDEEDGEREREREGGDRIPLVRVASCAGHHMVW